MTPLLAVSNLSVAYATGVGRLTAARAVSFDLAAGEALGLVGESGSGKSTIAGAILGLLGEGAIVASFDCQGEKQKCRFAKAYPVIWHPLHRAGPWPVATHGG
jgi:ABC-type glutathione transport system ATPase component